MELPSDDRFRVTHADGWLEVVAPANTIPLSPLMMWRALRFNATQSGPLHLAVAPGNDRPHLRGAVFAGDKTNFKARVDELCERARAILVALNSRTRPSGAILDWESTEASTAQPDGQRLIQLCAELDWPHIARGADGVDVMLECGHAHQARLQLTNTGGLTALVDLVDARSLTPVSRTATALLLLTASAVVRGVKGVVIQRDGVEHVDLAAACENPRSAGDVAQALGALSVACDLAGRETHALRHEALAREYLTWCAARPLDARADNDGVTNQSEADEIDNDNPCEVEERTCLQQL